jgi:hypothetical protein
LPCSNFVRYCLLNVISSGRKMANSQRTKIGIKAIEAMPTHSIIWDTATAGFNARRQNSNVVTFSVVYRTLEGTQRWQRLGR